MRGVTPPRNSCGSLLALLGSPHGSGRSSHCAFRAALSSSEAETYCSTKDAVLTTTVHPTQRRLMIALIVTLACLPLLVLDMVQGSTTSGATEAASNSSESSLVVAVVPSTEDPAPPTTVVAAVVPEVTVVPTTVAPAPVTVAPRVAPSTTTTTTTPRPVVTAAPIVQSDEAFLTCVRFRESRGDYTASDPSGTFLGAYQIYQGGWDSVAARIGRHDLVGTPPNQASPSDQDAIAVAMLRFHGRAPWGGSCR